MAELEVHDAVARLRAAFASGRSRDLSWRLGQLAGLGKLVRCSSDAFAAAAAEDLRMRSRWYRK